MCDVVCGVSVVWIIVVMLYYVYVWLDKKDILWILFGGWFVVDLLKIVGVDWVFVVTLYFL